MAEALDLEAPLGAHAQLNLADPRLGAVVVTASDEFFAPAERMLNASEPEWRAGVYDAHGKWMDGWETRRRRGPGFDHCVLRLAAAGTLAVIELDTRYFTGNFPPFASVEACRVAGDPDKSTAWTEVLARSPLQGDSRRRYAVSDPGPWTHLRLNIYPDGGIARLRAYGAVHRGPMAGAASVDLAAALSGGLALACSDEHYGSMANLLLPGRGASMADGWETRRRREPGYDWVILQLGAVGRIEAAEIDTAHFKGNYPHQISMHAVLLAGEGQGAARGDVRAESLYWPVLLEPQLLGADQVVRFESQLARLGPVSHVRVNIHPDGGLSRVRLFGRPGT
jgi:allantoicase